MSRWIVQTYAVQDPQETVASLRHRLPLDATVGVVDTDPGDGVAADYRADADDVQYEVVGLTDDQIVLDEFDRVYDINTDDVRLFEPYMNAALGPGEYGCVMSVNDTADAGGGHVYHKTETGSVEIVDEVSDEGTSSLGKMAARQCAEQYGFRPTVGTESRIEAAIDRRDDPLLSYRNVRIVEKLRRDGADALDGPLVPVGERDGCVECGAPVEENRYGHRRNEYLTAYWCTTEECRGTLSTYDPADFPSPADVCPDCGGAFAERDLQYPSLGSTAHECVDCGRPTFDVFDLPKDRLFPDAERSDLGPRE